MPPIINFHTHSFEKPDNLTEHGMMLIDLEMFSADDRTHFRVYALKNTFPRKGVLTSAIAKTIKS